MATFRVDVPDLLELVRRRTHAESLLRKRLIKFVAENVGDYIHGEKTFEILPFSLREMVLHQLVQPSYKPNLVYNQENVERMIEAYSLLVSSATKKIGLGGFISFCQKKNIAENTTKFLEAISTKATDLEDLDLIYEKRGTFFIKSQNLEENSIAAILRMENLKIIHFSLVEYVHVKRTCKNLKKLQYVKCARLECAEEDGDIEADIEEFKSSFSRLKVFLFQADSSSFEKELRKQCMQHLPKLEVVKNFVDTFENIMDCPELTIPVETSALRHLNAAPTTFDLPAAFPNVTHLRANCSKGQPRDKQHDSILRFANIESLTLHIQTLGSAFNPFLQAYGANLHTLMIHPVDLMSCLNFSFKMIFDACPKLQKLALFNVQLSDDKKTLKSFAQLRELHWEFIFCDSYNFDVTNILAAPNLEKFSLTDAHHKLSVGDLRKLTPLVADKKILNQLTSLNLDFYTYIDSREINNEWLLALRDFIAVAAAYLPNLTEFKLGLWCSDEESQLSFVHRPHLLERDTSKIRSKFQELIGDDSIFEFIRIINARNPL